MPGASMIGRFTAAPMTNVNSAAASVVEKNSDVSGMPVGCRMMGLIAMM